MYGEWVCLGFGGGPWVKKRRPVKSEPLTNPKPNGTGGKLGKRKPGGRG